MIMDTLWGINQAEEQEKINHKAIDKWEKSKTQILAVESNILFYLK